MLIIGDVLAFLAGLTILAISSWAIAMCMALMFSRRADKARDHLATKPWQSLVVGLLLALIPGTISLGLMASPVPGVKLAGFLAFLTLLGFAAVGFGGMATLVSLRVRAMAPDLSALGATGRASAVIVIACLFPLLGWFVFAPLALAFSLGAGFRAVLDRDPVLAAPPPVPEK
ncbi:MAG: hypothetical protein KIT74_03960 [Fimbriimonadales bacterium]|nr:hypothetical protein [Fimbriimonadales bacterium]